MDQNDSSADEHLKGKGEIIFVVEDDEDVRRMAIQQLSKLGYRTIEAADGRLAIDMIEKGATFDFLFSDVIMPGNHSGFDVAKRARMRYPDMPILLTSGFSGAAIQDIQDLMPSVHMDLLPKPYRKAELARKIREILDKKSKPA